MTELTASGLGSDLVAEPITGWRAWRLRRDRGGSFLLVPLVDGRPWPAGEALAAHCRSTLRAGRYENTHRSPDERCTCGVYALKASTKVRPMAHDATVVGTVSLWGRVIEQRRGYRAEIAYPARLRLICSDCMGAGWWSWSTPETVVERGDGLVALCAVHAPDGVARGMSVADVQGGLLAAYGVELLPIEGPEGSGSFVSRIRVRFRRITRRVPWWVLLILIPLSTRIALELFGQR